MMVDPFPYDGPIARVDGVRPFNRHLWHTECWWACAQFGHVGFSGRFHFGVIALNDGRFATDGFVWKIEANSDAPDGIGQRPGRPVVFETRERAIRIAVARFIRLCRWATTWESSPDRLTLENSRKAINWALGIAGRDAVAFRPISLPSPMPVSRQTSGLTLFDWEAAQ